MECGSPSRRSWADKVEEADSQARSSSALNPDAEPFFWGSSPAASGFEKDERLSFTDSKGSFGSDTPSSSIADKGKAVVTAGGRRRRPCRRHRHRRPMAQGGFMADAQRAFRRAGPATPLPADRLRSVVIHPTRLSVEPDMDGYRQVHSRRRWRHWTAPKLAKPVPAVLIGLCFNCLGDDLVKADCKFLSHCPSCRREGHHACYCPNTDAAVGSKRGRSPNIAGGHRGAPRRRASPSCWWTARDDTVSARSASTGRSPSVPHCCAPPSLDAVDQPASSGGAVGGGEG